MKTSIRHLLSSSLILFIVAANITIGSSCLSAQESADAVEETVDDMVWITIKMPDDADDYVSPHPDKVYIISDWLQRELEEKVDEHLDEMPFPEDRLLFINTKFITENLIGPSLYDFIVTFRFAAENTRDFIPELLFKVYLNDKDISDQIYYSSSKHGRTDKTYQVVQAVFNPKGYIDVSKSHDFIISLKDHQGIEHKFTLNFTPPGKGMRILESSQELRIRDDNSIELTDDMIIPLGKAITFEIGQSHPSSFGSPDDPVWTPYPDDEMAYIGNQFKKLDDLMFNTRYFPNDSLVFFGADCHLGDPENPPQMVFSFVIPYGDIRPHDLVKVMLNGEDCTDSLLYYEYPEINRHYNLCAGKFSGDIPLAPDREHTFEIIITSFEGKTYRKTLNCSVL